MWLLVGLGNPGSQYENTPHNFGFDAVDVFAKRRAWPWRDRSRDRAHLAEGDFAGERVVLMKPTTYMNLSGEAVVPYMRYYKIEPERLVVVSDDVAIPMGRLRLRTEGSDGGHKGLRSIAQHLGSTQFARLRIGIDPGTTVTRNLASFVLAKTHGAYREDAAFMVEKAADCLERIVEKGFVRAANEFNPFELGKD